MDLIDQTVSGVNEICLTDSINASLLKLTVKMDVNTVVPSSNYLIVYVDKASSSNSTTDRKQYVFNLNSSLKYYENSGDEFIEQIKIINNDIMLKTSVNRVVGDSGDYLLENILEEELESIPITLFEGVNYIYTNYSNAIITLTYPKNDDLNNMFLNNAIYSENKNNNSISLDDLYFKDAFTKTEDNLNLEVDNANISCLTSKNNKFSLDSDGNLTINSINCENGLMNSQNICNLIYPVGSIYLSLNSTNPTTLFGGVWEQLTDRFLVGAGSTYIGGSTGGYNSVYIAESNLPSRTMCRLYTSGSSHGANIYTEVTNGWTNAALADIPDFTSGMALENRPPYLAVYMWKRIA